MGDPELEKIRIKQERILDEYKLLEGYRETLSQRIGTLQSILVPAIFVILAVLLSQLGSILQFGALFAIVFLITCFLLLGLLYHGAENSMKEQDSAIVGMYPRMLELELEQGEMDFHAPYYFSRLDDGPKKRLGELLETTLKQINLATVDDENLRKIAEGLINKKTSEAVLRNLDYRNLRALLAQVDQRPQEVLLEIWQEFRYGSVIKGEPPAKGRGQAKMPDLKLGIIIVFAVIFSFILVGTGLNWWPFFPTNMTSPVP